MNPALQFRISNAGRGHLYGTVQSSDSWLTVDTARFSGNSVIITAKAVSKGRRATIEIDSNVGQCTVPVTMKPVRPWYRIGWVKYSVAFILIALCELFPAIALVDLMSSVKDPEGLGAICVGYVFPALGPLIGLGMALLITRTQMTDEDWKGYGHLFWKMPLMGIPMVLLGMLISWIISIVLGVKWDDIVADSFWPILILIPGYLIVCLIYYVKFEK